MKTISQIIHHKNFPLTILDSDGNELYYENASRRWFRCKYNQDGREIYYENSAEHWERHDYDSKGKETYYEDSHGRVKKNQVNVANIQTVQEYMTSQSDNRP